MDFVTMLKLAYQYGCPLVYSLIFIFVIYKFGVRVLDSYERREISYASMINEGLKNLTVAMTEMNRSLLQLHEAKVIMGERLAKDIKDGFDALKEMGKYQRDEHRDILAKVDESCQFFEKGK